MTIPLLIGLVGGPAAVIIKFWYKKKEGPEQSRFHDSGTYVRDDSLYSYDNTDTTNSEEQSSDKDKKNNS